jgi:hypothetical protein
MRAIVPGGLTIGEAVDQAIQGAADHERERIVSFVRTAADELVGSGIFPRAMAQSFVNMLEELADAIETLDHHEHEHKGETLQ